MRDTCDCVRQPNRLPICWKQKWSGKLTNRFCLALKGKRSDCKAVHISQICFSARKINRKYLPLCRVLVLRYLHYYGCYGNHQPLTTLRYGLRTRFSGRDNRTAFGYQCEANPTCRAWWGVHQTSRPPKLAHTSCTSTVSSVIPLYIDWEWCYSCW